MQSFKKYISESPELDEGKGKPGLWANIHAKRKRGERPAKPGEEGYPKTLNIEDVEESAKGYQPGWMLKKDPELAKKVKDKIDLAKKRQASYGNPAAGKSVKEESTELEELSKSLLHAYKNKAELSIPKDDREYKNRSKGIDSAEKRIKEEVVAEGYTVIARGNDFSYSRLKDALSDGHHHAAKVHKKGKLLGTIGSLSKQGAISRELKKRDVKEEVEQIDELSKKTLGSYVKKAASSLDHTAYSAGRHGEDDDYIKSMKRRKGIEKAADRLTKEEVEQIDELSKKTLSSYAKKANTSAMSAAHAVGSKRGVAGSDEHINKMFKRKAGVEKAVDRLTKEEVELEEAAIKVGDTVVYNKNKTAQTTGKVHKIEDNDYILHHTKTNTYHRVPKKGSELAESVEQLDELSPNLLHRYVKKASGNMGMHAVDHGRYGDEQKDKKSLNKAKKRLSGVISASGRMADKANRNEEVEHDIDSLQKHFGPNVAYDAASHRPAMMVRKDKAGKSHNLIRKPNGNYKSSEVKESEINDLAAQYINENNITLEELENMTEEELNELIGKAVGGAFKLGAKAAVGAGRLAGRAINRMTTSGRADAAEKKASALEKKNADRERIRAAQDRLRKAKEAASKR